MKIRQTVLLFAAFAFPLGAVALAGPAARAFTVDTQGLTNFDGSSKFADPDRMVENFGGPHPGSQVEGTPSEQASGYRRGQHPDMSGPLFRSLKAPIVGDGGYR
jgi:hypothetical protein